jgi:hypothetical protein
MRVNEEGTAARLDAHWHCHDNKRVGTVSTSGVVAPALGTASIIAEMGTNLSRSDLRGTNLSSLRGERIMLSNATWVTPIFRMPVYETLIFLEQRLQELTSLVLKFGGRISRIRPVSL